MFRKQVLFLTCLLLLPGVSCLKQKEQKTITFQDIKEGKLVIKSDTGELKQGSNNMIVEFQDSSGNLLPIDDADMSASMRMSGMPPMATSVSLSPTADRGRFLAQGIFQMGGTWKFVAEYSGPRGKGSATFDVNIK
jgi:hypothetical protein